MDFDRLGPRARDARQTRPGARLRGVRNAVRWLALAAAAVLIAGCGGGGGGGGASEPSAPQHNITAVGGTVSSADGKARLIVPAGAVSAPATLAIEKVEPDAATADDPNYLPGSSYRIVGDPGPLAQPATWELTLEAPLAVGSAPLGARFDVKRALSAGTPPPSTGYSCNGSGGKPVGAEWVLGTGTECPSRCGWAHSITDVNNITYSVCTPYSIDFLWDQTAPYCDGVLNNGQVYVQASQAGNPDLYASLFNAHGPGALCYRTTPPAPPVLVGSAINSLNLFPCVSGASQLTCSMPQVKPGVVKVLADVTPPHTAILEILDQPAGNTGPRSVTLDPNGNGTMRYVIWGGDERQAKQAELWELELDAQAGPNGLEPRFNYIKLATPADSIADPKAFRSSLAPAPSVPFNASDRLNRHFFARVYDAGGNFTDSPLVRVTRVTPVVEVATFGANPATLPPPSGTVTLSWTAANASALVIDQGVGDVTALTSNGAGSVQVNVSSTRTFTLTATGPNNTTATRSVTVTVAPDTTPPTVTLAANPGTVLAPGATTLTATATDNVGVTEVQFFRGSTLLGTDTTPGDGFTQAVNFTSADQGTASFTARAVDAAGNQTTSAATNVLVTVPMSADRYVSPTGSDANPGTQAQPYRTLTKAFANVGANGTVWLENGTYTWAAEATAGASQLDFKSRQFPAGRTLRAISPGLATVNFGFLVSGNATIVGIHITGVDGDGPGGGGTGVTVGGGASVNAQVQLKGVSFGALSGGSGDGWGAVVMNYCPTCTLTLDNNGVAGFNYIGPGFLPSARFITNLGGPVAVNGGTIGSPTLSTTSSGCASSVFTGHNASFNGVTFALPATAEGANAPAFCLLGSDPVTLANSTVTQQGSGREYLFMIGFGISGIPGNGNLVLDNSTVSAPPSGLLVGLRLAGVRFTATGSTLSGGSRTIGRVGVDGIANAAVTLTSTTVQNVNGTAIELDSANGATVRLTGGEIKNIQGSALRLTSAGLDARLRNVAISNTGISQGDGAVVLFGDNTSVYDLGTAAQPGGNTILGNNATRPGVRVNLGGGGAVNAVGNTWVANQQGASAAGTYSGNLVVTTGSGQNYVVTSGALRMSQ